MADKKNSKGKKKDKDAKGKSKLDARTSERGVVPPAPAPPPPVEEGDGDADPPIIISGGSVRIASKYFFDVTYDYSSQRFIYETKDIRVGKIKTRGKKDQEDDSDQGKFNIELYSE